LPQALFHLALALPVFAAVEYVSGDRVLPWGEVSFFLALAGGSATAGGRERRCANNQCRLLPTVG